LMPSPLTGAGPSTCSESRYTSSPSSCSCESAPSIDDLSETSRLSDRARSDSRLAKRASCAAICSGEVIDRGSRLCGVAGRVGRGVGRVDDSADMGNVGHVADALMHF